MPTQHEAASVFSEVGTELVLRWQEYRNAGKEVTPEELCVEHPEWLPEVSRQINAIRSMEAILGVGDATADLLAAQQPADALPAIQLPGYEIMGMIGHGGMGAVYKARQFRPNRIVAIKMMLAGPNARPEQLARFRTEAEAAAHLHHPHIVPIYEVGECGMQPYFSMEYIDGGSFAQRLAQGPLPFREAAEVMRTLAQAVQYAHKHGIIHRDLKPANILLADGQAGYSPKITDFGLAKRTDAGTELDPSPHRTKTGAVLGTPSYLAPEQAEGKTNEIGAPADIYALGAILYEALVGRPPFQGESTLDTLEQVRTHEPIPPRKLRHSVPVDLETICLKCLEKKPTKRYATADDLADDLMRFLAGESIQARRTPLWERTLKLAKRKPAHAALGLVSTAALFGVVGVWGSFTADLQSERNRAQKLQQEAEEQADVAKRDRDLIRELNEYTQRLLFRCQEDVKWHISATLEGKAAKETSGDPHALLYVLARSYAMTAGVYRKDMTLTEEDRNRQAEFYAANAVSLLRKAWEMGYFQTTSSRSKLKDDKDLNDLRTRNDFKELMAKMERPRN